MGELLRSLPQLAALEVHAACVMSMRAESRDNELAVSHAFASLRGCTDGMHGLRSLRLTAMHMQRPNVYGWHLLLVHALLLQVCSKQAQAQWWLTARCGQWQQQWQQCMADAISSAPSCAWLLLGASCPGPHAWQEYHFSNTVVTLACGSSSQAPRCTAATTPYS